MSSEATDCAVRVEALGKCFHMYRRPLDRLLQGFVGADRPLYREFWALRDIDFSVARGETLGIVGRNGSGKSTLLQIICGTLRPTVGSVTVQGRIAALLELGAGFNPEFSGRDNVMLNGSVLGLARSEIEARFDDIAAFADIGDFMEQPVKSYSSGMYIRLAFAVATSVEPDVLIVDEALSVGDEAFQRKCFARIQRIRDAGGTVLFVSHSAGTVTQMCTRALLLDRGEALLLGSARQVVSRYHKLLYAPADRVEAIRQEIRETAPAEDAGAALVAAAAVPAVADDAYFEEGLVPKSTLRYAARGAHIEDARVETLDGRRVNVLCTNGEYFYRYRVRFDEAAWRVRCGMLIKTISGLELGGGVTATTANAVESVDAGATLEVRFRFRCLLMPGTYFLNAGVLGVLGEGEEYLDRLIDVAMFRVKPDPERLATALVDFSVVPELRAVRTEATT